MENPNETQTALQAGLALANIRQLGRHPLVVVPDDTAIHSLEKFLPAPLRKKGHTTLNDVGSFILLVNAEKKPSTRLYGNLINPLFHAVFNDHADGTEPGWQDHSAKYACPLSIEWKTWLAQSGRQMSQADFAAFIENNLPDIASPPAADMLEISRSLEAKKKVNFASGIRLSNGQNELTYEEEITGTAQKGKLSVPEIFTIGIPVLEGGARYQVEAKLRYRIADGGKLTMWFELVRPHKILEHAVTEVRVQIETATALLMLNGTPG